MAGAHGRLHRARHHRHAVRALDGTRTQAFYVAHAGLEKLTADLGDLFSVNFAPTGAQINALTADRRPRSA